MMSDAFYLKDSKKFWETRKKAREAKDKRLARLPFSEKAVMTERIQADYEVLRNARGESNQFGISEIPPDAINELSFAQPFGQGVLEQDLNKAFPFTQELQADQESSKI
ncbi:MAG: hypothetical protein PVJ08_00940 [Dehalococcoidia bacterium]|jgi:hypothetical protein